MTIATLADVDAAMYTALSALVATPPDATHPFASVIRFAGAVPPEGLPAPKFPCVALRFDDEVADFDVDVLSDAESRSVATWSVLVQVDDPQDIDRGMVGNGAALGRTGILRCLSAAVGACNGLRVDGTYRGRLLKYVGARPEMVVRNGLYVYAARIAVRLYAPMATNANPYTTGLEEIAGNVNLEDTTDPADNPVVQFVSDTTTP